MPAHHYTIQITWTGNKGEGTATYRSYERSHTISAVGKVTIDGSSDQAFRGDKTKYNPEEFLLAALSSCHMLAYLHLCTTGGVVVTAYTDSATGTMEETPNGGGHFTEVTLHPAVTVSHEAMIDKANALHEKANELCFIANSVNFPVRHEAGCVVRE